MSLQIIILSSSLDNNSGLLHCDKGSSYTTGLIFLWIYCREMLTIPKYVVHFLESKIHQTNGQLYLQWRLCDPCQGIPYIVHGWQFGTCRYFQLHKKQICVFFIAENEAIATAFSNNGKSSSSWIEMLITSTPSEIASLICSSNNIRGVHIIDHLPKLPCRLLALLLAQYHQMFHHHNQNIYDTSIVYVISCSMQLSK